MHFSVIGRACVNHHHLTGIRHSRRHSTTCFSNCCSDGSKLSSGTSLITLRSGEGLTSNFCG